MKLNNIIIAFILVCFIFVNHSNAQISKQNLETASIKFISNNSIFDGYSINKDIEIKDLFYENNQVAYLVSLKPKGFILFSYSTKMNPIYGYSNQGSFDNSEKNPLANIILSQLNLRKELISNNETEYLNIIQENQEKWNELLNSTKGTNADVQYGNWLSDVWGGVNCYDNSGQVIYVGNYFTPNHFSPGCVATSLSQILNYYKWPPRGNGSHTNYDNSGSSQGDYYAQYSKMEYDWANMLDKYQGKASADIQRRAMGRLAYHCSVATDMDYENNSSTSNTVRVPDALSDYFRSIGHFESRSWSSFVSRLQENLENEHPVQLVAQASNGDEHAFVCDGYRYNIGGDKYYHLNMGWWNDYGANGWYKIFDSFSAAGYNTILSGIFDIMPEPYIEKAIRTEDPNKFYVRWKVSKTINWDAFELQESVDNGSWTTISSSIQDTFYLRTVTADGLYKYRVRTKLDGSFYADSWSGYITVPVGKSVYLDFDGDDSFFVNDNVYNDLDLSNSWTYEAWVNVDTYTNNDWSIIMDRRTVFSLYLLNDSTDDFAVRFAVRDASDNIVESLRSDQTSSDLSFNQWFHVAVSYDGNLARLFLNGKLVDSSNSTSFVLNSSTKALNIGARYWGSYSRYLDGQLDEIRISKIARYTNDFCPDRFERFTTDANTTLLFNLDNGIDTYIYDASHHFLGTELRASPNTANWGTQTCVAVNSQPENQSICGGSTIFSVDAQNSSSYQWQYNSGSGFNNVINGGVYSNVDTDSLNISDVSGLDGYVFRCIVESNQVQSCSDEATLSVFNNCTIWDGTSWSNGIPDASTSAIIDANYTTSSDIEAENLTINDNDTLIIQADNTFSVIGNLENHGTLIQDAENNNSLTGALITETINNYGTMLVRKFLSAPHSTIEDNTHLFCSNVDNSVAMDDIFNSNEKVLFNTESTYTWSDLDYSSDYIYTLKPYMYQTPNSTGKIVEFNGTVFTGDKTFTLYENLTNDRWHFIYNPYSSPIDWDASSGWTKNNIYSTLYTYDLMNNGNTNNFSAWDGTVGIHNGYKYINSMQAYFVKAADSSASVISTNEVRVKNSDVSQNTNTVNNLIRFQFKNTNQDYDEAVIYFANSDGASLKAQGLNSNSLYTFINANSNKYCIYRYNQNEPDTITSVGFQCSQAGVYTFKVTEFNFTNINIVLEDLYTGDVTILANNTEYSFNAGTSEPLNRFKIYFGYTGINSNFNNNINIYSFNKTIYIKTQNTDKTYYEVYNMNSQTIKKGQIEDVETIISGFKIGVYAIKLINNKGVYSRKVIIN